MIFVIANALPAYESSVFVPGSARMLPKPRGQECPRHTTEPPSPITFLCQMSPTPDGTSEGHSAYQKTRVEHPRHWLLAGGGVYGSGEKWRRWLACDRCCQ